MNRGHRARTAEHGREGIGPWAGPRATRQETWTRRPVATCHARYRQRPGVSPRALVVSPWRYRRLGQGAFASVHLAKASGGEYLAVKITDLRRRGSTGPAPSPLRSLCAPQPEGCTIGRPIFLHHCRYCWPPTGPYDWRPNGRLLLSLPAIARLPLAAASRLLLAIC